MLNGFGGFLIKVTRYGLGSFIAIHGVDEGLVELECRIYVDFGVILIKKWIGLAFSNGIDLISMMHKKIGNGSNTSFWKDRWRGEQRLKEVFPRSYALEVNKHIRSFQIFEQTSLLSSLLKMPRSGIIRTVGSLLRHWRSDDNSIADRWSWDLNGSGKFHLLWSEVY
ncbi:hypothetical protein Tco_0752169 [Tanacetum coccineum]|uniref:RNA-directed DNA polymerase, eukaryota, reverse transcriptase zinc-binding domain protein n=1 Tax=Tanacetum coccineum TaxID=301880 RepID=A0ABQ4Z9S7_9ASTR